MFFLVSQIPSSNNVHNVANTANSQDHHPSMLLAYGIFYKIFSVGQGCQTGDPK